MRRVRQYMLTTGMLLLAGAMLACGGPWRDGYFKRGVDRLTQDEVVEKFGPPHTAKTPALGGDSVWTYRVPLAENELSSLHFAGLSNAATQATSLGKGPKKCCIATAIP
jgi:hypothetical protein